MFDPANPNKKFVKQVIHQAWNGGLASGPVDFYAEAWCLREMELAEYHLLEKHMIDSGLIEESGEPGFFKLTRKGMSVQNGEDY